jgi:serine/threonine-protein kinase
MATVPAGLAAALQDRYPLDRELGQGGMATVYLSRDLSCLNQRATIRTSRPPIRADRWANWRVLP